MNKILEIPQKIVNRIGMYRLVTAALVALVALSLAAGVTGAIYYSVRAQLTSLVIAAAVAFITNVAFARIFRVDANHESALITALIMFFMMIPNTSLTGNWELAAGVGLAISSKFLLAIRRQHIFNPAAIGAVLLALIVTVVNAVRGSSYNTDIFSWWVANPVLLIPVLIFGVLITVKVHRLRMVAAFIVSGLVVFLIESQRYDPSVWNSTKLFFGSYPTLFLGFVMLTEPFTTPPRRNQQIVYGALVGGLAATSVFAPILSMTPELALVVGNLFAYAFRHKQKFFLTFKERKEIAKNTFEFSFAKPEGLTYLPGQYGEWTLTHPNPDSRGTRRYFTILSAPSEPDVRVAFRIVSEDSQRTGSTYKSAFMGLNRGDEVVLSQIAGDFVLPKTQTKIAMIAGGIGVTPFISHLASMGETQTEYDVAMFYCVRNRNELAYVDTFADLSQKLNLDLVAVISKGNEDTNPRADSEWPSVAFEYGYLSEALLSKRTPDFKERLWYVSGPPAMVNVYRDVLVKAGVSRNRIKTDYFAGLT